MKRLFQSILLVIGLLAMSFSASYAQTSSFSTKKNQDRYKYQLEQLNAFLADFKDGYYGQMAVEDGFVIIRYQDGYYSKFRIEDMADPELYTRWGQISWNCKNESLCVETDWNEAGKESGILFSDFGSIMLEDLMELLTNFINAYKGK
jgi:hypothetical protein